ncbi:Vitellogenin domain-containing protein [Sergentomyia squamirostris]
MGSFRVVLLFSCVALLGLGCVESRYLGDFKHGEFNASVYDYALVTRNGILKTGYEYTDTEKLRMEIIPYGKDSIFVRLHLMESLISSRNEHMGTDKNSGELIAERPTKRICEFILNDEGKLFVKKSEPKFLINFLKNFASILILDYDKLNQRKISPKWIYNVDQPTIYGSCSMQNIATFGKDGSAVVEQNFDPRDCSNFHPIVFSDVETVKDIRGLSINNYRKYDLLKRESGGYFPEKVETSQKIYWKPSNKNSLTHVLEISHKITFAEAKSLSLDDSDFDFSTPYNLEFVASAHNHFEDGLKHRTLQFLYHLNSDTLLDEIKMMIEHISNMWNRQKIYAPDYEYLISQELTKTNIYLLYATNEQLFRLWEDFKKDTSEDGVRILNAYYRILPLVGTEGSVLLIRKLILDKEVSTEVGDKMLTKLAGNIRLPSLKVLEAMKEICHATFTDASMLAYSAALGTALQDYPDSEKIKIWVKDSITKGIDMISNALNDYKKVRILLLCLGNFRSVSLKDEAILGLKNKLAKTNQDLLLYMLIAFENTTPSGFLFDQMLEILQDPEYNNELKATAVGIALKYLPSMKHFEVLARFMDTQTNYELYNFFESTVRSLIELQQIPSDARNWLRHRDPSSRSTTFLLHSPDDYPMKISILAYVAFSDTNNALQVVYAEIYQNYYDKPVKLYTVHLRLSGTEIFNSPSGNFDHFMAALLKGDKINYEFTLYKGDRVVLSDIDNIDVQNYIKQYSNLFRIDNTANIKFELEEIFQDWHFDYYLPTDFGNNARIYFNIPRSVSILFKLGQRTEKEISLNVLASLNYTAQSTHGMYLYQPKLEAFQGSMEISSFHFTQQIAFAAAIEDKANGYLELRDDVTPLSGFRVKKDTLVHFKKLGNDTIQFKDDKELPIFLRVHNTYLEHHPKDLLLIHSDIGAKFQVRVDYYDAPAGMEEFPTTLSALMYQNPFSSFFSLDIEDLYPSVLNYLGWNFLAYSAYTYNFKATMEPCKIFQIKKYRFRVTSQSLYIDLLEKQDKLRVSYQFTNHPGYVEFLRSGPGLESIGACFHHPVDKANDNVYQLYYGTKYGNITECPRDQFQLTLATKSEFSADQIENRNSDVFSYEECLNPSIYLPARDTTNTLKCAKAATSLRDFTVNVNFKNPPKEFLTDLHQFWRWFQKIYGAIPSENDLRITDQGEITAKFDFPLSTNKMNLEVFFPKVKYTFRNLPRILMPENAVYDDYFEVFDYILPSTVCTVVACEDLVKSSKHIYHNTSPWTVYFNNTRVSVSVKNYGKDQLALKIIYLEQTITVVPNDSEVEGEDKYVISLGETSVDEVPMDCSSKRIRTFRILDTVFFSSDAHYKFHTFIVGYNGHSVMMAG